MEVENTLAGSNQPEPSTPATEPEEVKAEESVQEAGQSEPEKPEAEKADGEDKREKRKSSLPPWVQDLRREKRNLQRQVSRLNRQIGELKAKAPPRQEDFPDEAEYQRAVLRHASHEASLEQQVTAVRTEQEALNERAREAWIEIAGTVQSEIPDFEAKVFSETNPISPLMAELMLESDNPAQLAYWLANNRATALRLSRMESPLEVARELGRIEARLTAPKPKVVSSAPKPVPTVGGASAGMSAKDLHALASQGEDATAFIEEMRRRRQGA